MKRFVDPNFPVPSGLETETFRLRMLTVHDVVKDFDAVVASGPFLRKLFPGWGGWPEGLTLEQNLIDLGWHHKEFQRRRSFAYTVVTLDESRVVGCVYVVPSQREGYEAEVYFWARESAQGDAADSTLAASVMPWVETAWPFQRVAYPGRAIDWSSWDKAPLKGG